MSLSGPGAASISTLSTSSASSDGGEPPSPGPLLGNQAGVRGECQPSQPLSVVGGNQREGSVSVEGHSNSFLSSGFSAIRNMELYPPRAKVIGACMCTVNTYPELYWPIRNVHPELRSSCMCPTQSIRIYCILHIGPLGTPTQN